MILLAMSLVISLHVYVFCHVVTYCICGECNAVKIIQSELYCLDIVILDRLQRRHLSYTFLCHVQ